MSCSIPAGVGPIELVVLQSTSFCNLDCSYCYLTPASRKSRKTLPAAALSTIFGKILSSPYVGRTMQVSWHSGEPLVLGPAYYASAMETILALRDEYCSAGVDLRFDMQTNGTLIDQQWCDLFAKYRSVLTVGVSCDGPAFLHDAHRRDWAGRPSHERTRRGIDLLRDNGIDFDLIAVVSLESLQYAREFLAFFHSYRKNVREFHFNLLDELPAGATEETYGAYAIRYHAFLTSLLNILSEANSPDDIIKIRNFISFYRRIFASSEVKRSYTARSMSRPLRTLNVEANGDVSTFYAGLTSDECREIYGDGRGLVIGNLLEQDLDEIVASNKLQRIAGDFENSHRACELTCEYFAICSGGYNLVKYKRFGTFEAAETPECVVHVKTFANALLEHLSRDIRDDRRGSQAPAAASRAADL